ncbi:unnamed protein product [Adineta ricciae]|uniref:SET domain-containing protein n=1 Tax=Adineta ricciae TaxID=249248 RepID=A0A815LYQ2_ADIRI|nr:unnamed protein product [Adineta ricciae]CAF1412168.1 unnamed protein product [Adineta ricciae]
MKTDENADFLNTISPYFSVKPTKYGGRGCFANTDLVQGTIVHRCSSPLSSTITRPFKKQVCESCFKFSEGKTFKFKLTSRKNTSTSTSPSALYFCSQSCMDKFIALDIDDLYLESVLNVERLFLRILKDRCQMNFKDEEEQETEMILKLENELKQSNNNELFISQKWQEVEMICQLQLSKLKTKQRQNLDGFIPRINENEYLDIKYIIGILCQMYKNEYKSLSSESSSSLELQIFPYLQSNDVEKIFKYPYLLHSYTNKIYKFLKFSTCENLQPYITPPIIRSIIGKTLTNVYGIWSIDETNGNEEFFGYSLYPSASFFNHSCHPNVIKIKNEGYFSFKLLRNVQKNEELCVNYGVYINDDFETRQKFLKQWFFDCLCQRCVEEINVKNKEKV